VEIPEQARNLARIAAVRTTGPFARPSNTAGSDCCDPRLRASASSKQAGTVPVLRAPSPTKPLHQCVRIVADSDFRGPANKRLSCRRPSVFNSSNCGRSRKSVPRGSGIGFSHQFGLAASHDPPQSIRVIAGGHQSSASPSTPPREGENRPPPTFRGCPRITSGWPVGALVAVGGSAA